MDFKKYFLIGGLAVISYLMLLAWNEDYPLQQSGSFETAETETAMVQNEITDVPSDTPPVTNTVADVPQVNNEVSPEAQNQVLQTGLITVSTPTQRVTINPLGGDIVSLSLTTFPTTLENPDDPFVLLRNDVGGVYVAQSGLAGSNGPDASANGRPLYQSTQQEYSLDDKDGELEVVLTYSDGAVQINKKFNFSGNDYLIDVQYEIINNSDTPWSANLYGQIKRDGGEDPSEKQGFGMNTYLGAVMTLDNDPYKEVSFDDIDDGGTRDTLTGGWIGFSQHYFIGAWVPDSESSNTYVTRKNRAGQYIMEFITPATTVAPGQSATMEAGFWAGPKDQYRLEEIATDLGKVIDYSWLWFIASPIFWMLVQINDVVDNYGWSIILLTITIKLMFSLLSAKSYRSMAKMRKLAPKIQALKDRYGDDKQKLMQAQMELWRKEKANPLGGCLPMLLQMPVLLGMYWVLNESVELRHAHWVLWYDDLSAMDPFFILPLVMGASMFISQLMTPITTADPMQAKVMRLMPIFFTVFFLFFPSGLVLYWLVSNVFNIIQQSYINWQVDKSYKKSAS